jgi:hypothetical protein
MLTAALPVRRGGRNTSTMVVNPSREFEDIYDRMGQLMNFAFGLTPAALADMPWVPLADLSETDDAGLVPGCWKRQQAGRTGPRPPGRGVQARFHPDRDPDRRRSARIHVIMTGRFHLLGGYHAEPPDWLGTDTVQAGGQRCRRTSTDRTGSPASRRPGRDAAGRSTDR